MWKLFMNISANTFHFKTFLSVPQCPTMKAQRRSRAEKAYPVANPDNSSPALRTEPSETCARDEAQVGLPGGQPES